MSPRISGYQASHEQRYLGRLFLPRRCYLSVDGSSPGYGASFLHLENLGEPCGGVNTMKMLEASAMQAVDTAILRAVQIMKRCSPVVLPVRELFDTAWISPFGSIAWRFIGRINRNEGSCKRDREMKLS